MGPFSVLFVKILCKWYLFISWNCWPPETTQVIAFHRHLVRRQFAGNNSKEGGQWWILSQPSDRNKPNWSQTRWLNSFESQILCSWSACLLVSCSYVTPVTPPRRFIDRYWRVYASRLWVALECWSRRDTNNIQNLIRVIRLKHTQSDRWTSFMILLPSLW